MSDSSEKPAPTSNAELTHVTPELVDFMLDKDRLDGAHDYPHGVECSTCHQRLLYRWMGHSDIRTLGAECGCGRRPLDLTISRRGLALNPNCGLIIYPLSKNLMDRLATQGREQFDPSLPMEAMCRRCGKATLTITAKFYEPVDEKQQRKRVQGSRYRITVRCPCGLLAFTEPATLLRA